MTRVALPDGRYTAVVDNIEDGLATLFFEQGDEQVGNAVLDATTLPTDGRHADAMLQVTIADGELVEASYDPSATERRGEQAQSRFDRLSERPPNDEDS